jgi:hypothetical protein
VFAKQVLYSLSYTSSPFCSGYFGDRVSELLAHVGLKPLSSQSDPPQVTNTTSMSHQHLARNLKSQIRVIWYMLEGTCETSADDLYSEKRTWFLFCFV